MHTHDAISRYLAELESAMRGADPALIHDAIIEARAHLTETIINGASAEDAIRAFGEPSEIAKAYLDAEATSMVASQPPPLRLRPPPRPPQRPLRKNAPCHRFHSSASGSTRSHGDPTCS
jgi:hypothetical protein